MEFICNARQSGQRLVATVAGDVDLAVYPRFRAEAEDWAGKGTDIVVDCSGVTFMDSMGLRVLVELRKAVTDAGHTLVLVDPSQPVARLLDLAGVREVFGLGTGRPPSETGTATETGTENSA